MHSLCPIVWAAMWQSSIQYTVSSSSMTAALTATSEISTVDSGIQLLNTTDLQRPKPLLESELCHLFP